jgi:DNA-binding FadR family transcriptional regulator
VNRAVSLLPPLAVERAVFGQVRGGNAFEETVERLLQAIKLGVVRQGERFPSQRDLAGRLGVSRVTLREAFRALEQSGYVESRRGRAGGTFVLHRPRPPQPKSGQLKRVLADMGVTLNDTLTYRWALEVGAAEQAASRHLDDDDHAVLLTCLSDAEAASLSDFRQMDSRLHLAIAELSGSLSLAAAVADVRMRVNDLLDAIPLLPRNLEHATIQHRQVVHAILAGDAPTARRATEEHLEGTAALLRGFLS